MIKRHTITAIQLLSLCLLPSTIAHPTEVNVVTVVTSLQTSVDLLLVLYSTTQQVYLVNGSSWWMVIVFMALSVKSAMLCSTRSSGCLVFEATKQKVEYLDTVVAF